MIQAFFFDLQAINAGKLRPEGIEPFTADQGRRARRRDDGRRHRLLLRPRRHGGRAQGRRGRGAPRRARPTREKLLDKAIARGTLDRGEEGRAARPDHRRPPTRPTSPGCDLVIEAVFEDPSLKHQVFAEIAPHVEPRRAAVLQHLDAADHRARRPASTGPADFIGLHFFSPVDKMPLVEIIRGEQTSDEALAKAYDVVQQIRKTPIVVNDSRGFYTSRVIGTMVNEGLAMLAEGVHPMSLERAATQAGYPVGPLQLSDELNMELMAKIAQGHRRTPPSATARRTTQHPGERGRRHDDRARPARRGSRAPASTSTTRRASGSGLWPGLAEAFPVADRAVAVRATSRTGCCSSRRSRPRSASRRASSTSAAAANIGSIMGIGFPPNTGGAAQFMTGYQARTTQDRPDRAGGVRRPGRRARRGVRRPVPAHGVPARPGGEGRVLPGLTGTGRALSPAGRTG